MLLTYGIEVFTMSEYLFFIRFDPPGQMSAGLTCEMMVTFKPMVRLCSLIDFKVRKLFYPKRCHLH